jgi:hypothetical protein
MENIVLQPVQQEYVEFMALPMGVYKNIQYYNNIQGRTFFESNLCKKDGCMYYSHSIFKVKKSKNGYYRQNSGKHGFTFNEKGKLSVWYGKNIFETPGIWAVFTHLNMNWLNHKLIAYVTKSIAEKILNGKLTNNLDVVKAYIKTMRLNCSPKLLLNVIEDGSSNKPHLLQMMSVAKDQNHFLEKVLNTQDTTTNYIIIDLVKQAHILGKTIDFTWSERRMKEEHQEWTKEIMEEEIKDMEDVTATSILPFLEFKYPGVKLLTTKKEIFTEGKEMSHCVYTNYWASVNAGNYLVYQIDFCGERATLGINMYDGNITYNQCYRQGNQPISHALKEFVNTFIEKLTQWAEENNIFKQRLPF